MNPNIGKIEEGKNTKLVVLVNVIFPVILLNVISFSQNLTMNSMLEKTKNLMGNKFFTYSGKDNSVFLILNTHMFQAAYRLKNLGIFYVNIWH